MLKNNFVRNLVVQRAKSKHMGDVSSNLTLAFYINQQNNKMTEEQIKNSIELCKNHPLSEILRLFQYWGQEEIDAMAKYFKCEADQNTVAFHLMIGK